MSEKEKAKVFPFGSKVNVPLWKQIKEQILKEPQRFEMDEWFSDKGFCEENGGKVPVKDCGTAACFGGWAWLLTADQRGEETAGQVWLSFESAPVAKLLGLAKDNILDVFNHRYWHQPYRDKFSAAEPPEEKARVAAAYIDYIIGEEHGGDQCFNAATALLPWRTLFLRGDDAFYTARAIGTVLTFLKDMIPSDKIPDRVLIGVLHLINVGEMIDAEVIERTKHDDASREVQQDSQGNG